MGNVIKQNITKKAVGANSDRLSSTLAFDSSVRKLNGVSSARALALEKMGIATLRDLLYSFPRRYIDLSSVESIQSAHLNEQCSITGTVYELKLKRPRPRLTLCEITLIDSTGTLIVTCFKQPWLMDKLAKGMRITVSGKVEISYGYKRMTNPFIEVLEAGQDNFEGTIIPVHPACEKVTTAMMRRFVRLALDEVSGLQDPIPLNIRQKYGLMSRMSALETIHFPLRMEDVAAAKRRLIYEEVLFLQLALMQDTFINSSSQFAHKHTVDGPKVKRLQEVLPFELTADQSRAKEEILTNMASSKQMNHLLLGDVGTGKTAVAAFAIVAAAESGNQVLMMAPTEVLARQYALSIGSLLDKLEISWEVLTGSTKPNSRQEIVSGAANQEIKVLFGTHALLEDDIVVPACSLIIIDEQQRFGVEQRAKLASKAKAPDSLFLTATPIPRTLALALFGNLTLSYLHERPNKQATRTTRVVPKTDSQQVWESAREALERGEQVYVVCPLVGIQRENKNVQTEEAYEYASIAIEAEDDFCQASLSSAKQLSDKLQAGIFYGFEVGLLHGKMPGAEKLEIMQKFRDKEIDILVSTTVIEVGIDVPNASVMIIEDADRFGLSQLHQLRGRVGRGTLDAYVYLISSSTNKDALARLSAMEVCDDGFELANYDLSLRREGDILGNKQHGAGSLKLVNVVRDGAIIEAAHADAQNILENDKYLKSASGKFLSYEMHILQKNDANVVGG